MLIYLIPTLLTIAGFLTRSVVDNNGCAGLSTFLVVIAIVTLIICLIITFATSGNIAKYKTEITQHTRNKKVAEERFDAIKTTIASYSDKFPIEKDLLKSFQPSVLLMLPEIKSDKFLLEQINMAVSYQKTVYSKIECINSCKQGLEWFQTMCFILPRLITSNYDKVEAKA
jgi:hypothetical protein